MSAKGLEFHYAMEHEFLIADIPAAAFNKENNAVGALNGVAWGNADALFMPLGPRNAVALAKDNSYLGADARTVEWINVQQVRGAYKEIYFRPGSGLGAVISNALRKNTT